MNRQSLYKNPHWRARIETAAQELGLSSIEARKDAPTRDDGKDQRIHFLESQVASLQAENHGLRSQLSQLRHIEAHLVETGRRVIP